jgi:hypothetical protein
MAAGSDAMFFNYYLAKKLKINHNPMTIKAFEKVSAYFKLSCVVS